MAAPFPLFLEVRCVWRAEGAPPWREGELFEQEGKEVTQPPWLVDPGREQWRLSGRQSPVPFPERGDPRAHRSVPCLTWWTWFYGVWHQIWFHFRGLGTKRAM